MVNSTIRLECGTDDESAPLKWKRLSNDKHISVGTLIKLKLKNIFTIDNPIQGRYDLIVRPGLEDADSYMCEDTEQEFSIILIVLGKWLQVVIFPNVYIWIIIGTIEEQWCLIIIICYRLNKPMHCQFVNSVRQSCYFHVSWFVICVGTITPVYILIIEVIDGWF